MGVLRHESYGDIFFKDEKNGYEFTLKLSNVSKKYYNMFQNRPTDYFNGEIILNKVCISKVNGSYLEFIEFDSKRYWDIRENIEVKVRYF